MDANCRFYANFSCKYMSSLLLSLIKVWNEASINGGDKKDDHNEEIRELVKFEVDMAFAVSANGSRWSEALKHKLHVRMNRSKHPSNQPIICTIGNLERLQFISRPLVYVELGFTPKSRSRALRRRGHDECEVGEGVRALRRMLPGGSDMRVHELFSEVESYVVCLELQVKILRALVGPQKNC